MYIATHELPFGVDAFLVQDARYLNDQAEILYHGKKFPNPVHHWAIVVGDFEHELNAEASQQIVYQNRRVEYSSDRKEMKTHILGNKYVDWKIIEWGKTKHNDRSIQQHGMSSHPTSDTIGHAT